MIAVMWCLPPKLLAAQSQGRLGVSIIYTPKPPGARRVSHYNVRLHVKPVNGGHLNEYRVVVATTGRVLAVFVVRYSGGKRMNDVALDLEKPQAQKVIRALRRKEKLERVLHGMPNS